MKTFRSLLGWGVVFALALILVSVALPGDTFALAHGSGVGVSALLTGLGLMGSTEFGAPFRAVSNAAVEAAATPPSGSSAEAIWHQLYDTQTFTDNSTVRLTFFTNPSADRTLTNMAGGGGTLPRPQTLQIYNITLDILSTIPVTTSATLTGVLNDLALLIFGAAQRPTWTLTISDKSYGPYSLTTLHGTGGPVGFGFSSDGAEIIQFAKNDPAGGWNYRGRVIIPEQANFQFAIDYAATADISEDKRFRVSLFGVLNRRVL
jgi:hypothetical protein